MVMKISDIPVFLLARDFTPSWEILVYWDIWGGGRYMYTGRFGVAGDTCILGDLGWR